MKSIRFQASRVVNTAIPTRAARHKVRSKLVGEMRKAGPVELPPLTTDEQVYAEIDLILNCGLINKKAASGVPLDQIGRQKGAVMEHVPTFLRELICDMVRNWLKYGFDFIRFNEVVTLLQMSIVFPTLVKIKQEPHSKEKLAQERYRIFFAMSMIMELMDRLLYQRIVMHEAAQWRTLPVKPGIGFTDEMMRDLFAYVDSLPGNREDNDGSGYDWSERYWMMSDVTEATILAYDIDAIRAELMRINCILAFKTPWQTSDGKIYEVFMNVDHDEMDTSGRSREWLVWKSGKFITARDNSWARIGYAHHAALNIGRLDESWAVTMGDDCVESDLDRDYSVFGLRITDRTKSRKGEPFQFCSRYITAKGDGALIPWGKTLYRLLSNKPSFEFMAGFDWELRHNRELKYIHNILWKIGYFESIQFIPQCKRGFGVCSLPDKDLADSAWMSSRIVQKPKQKQLSVSSQVTAKKKKKKQKPQATRSAQSLVTQGLRQEQGMNQRVLSRATNTLRFPGENDYLNKGQIHVWEPFLRAMERPFNSVPQKAPVSYDIAPTFRTHVARTTVTLSGFSLAAGNVTTLHLAGVQTGSFPNRSQSMQVSESATLRGPQQFYGGAQSVVAGPCPVDSPTGVFGPSCVYQSASVAATALGGPGFTTSVATPHPWDVPMPYLATSEDSNALRWRLTALGIRVKNVTTTVNKGGEVWTVIPTYAVSWIAGAANSTVGVGQMAYEPSLRAWGADSFEIAVPVQPRHLGYTATNMNLVPNGDHFVGAPLMMLMFYNNTSVTNSYDIQIEYHWEIGGDTVFQLGSHAVHFPAAKAAIEPAIAHSTQSPTGASGIVTVARVAHDVATKGLAAASAVMGSSAMGKAAEFAGQLMAAIGH